MFYCGKIFWEGDINRRFFNSNDGYGNGRYDSLGENKKGTQSSTFTSKKRPTLPDVIFHVVVY